MASNLPFNFNFDFSPPHLDYNNNLFCLHSINLSPPPSDCLPHSHNPSPLSYIHSLTPITNSSPPTSDCLPHSLTLSPLPCVYPLTSINDHDHDNYTECVKNDQRPWAVTASLAYPATFR